MKKIKIVFFLFSIAFLAISCRQELLQSENQKTELLKKEFIIQRLSYYDLRDSSPLVLEKIVKISPNSNKENRIYTDSTENFSVDTNKAILIQDNSGQKSYTFKINRTPPNNKLENLILVEKSKGLYKVYISEYDDFLLQNTGLTNSEIKNHFHLYSLGEKSHSQIFGKMAVCYETIAYYVAVPIYSPCSSKEAHTNPADCSCTNPNSLCTPPKQIGVEWQTEYSFQQFDCGGSSTSGATNVDMGNTIPLGGSGSGTLNVFANPCNKVKNPFTKVSSLGQNLVTLTGQTSAANEQGVTMMNNADNNTVNPIQNLNIGQSGSIDIPQNPTHPYILIAHTHNSPASATYSVPSWEDFMALSYSIQNNLNFADVYNLVYIIITADGTKYAVTIEDLFMFTNMFYQPDFHKDDFDIDLFKKNNETRGKYYYGTFNPLISKMEEPKIQENSTDYEQDLKYMMEMLKTSGMNVFEINADFTSFTKITYNKNTQQIIRTLCQ